MHSPRWGKLPPSGLYVAIRIKGGSTEMFLSGPNQDQWFLRLKVSSTDPVMIGQAATATWDAYAWCGTQAATALDVVLTNAEVPDRDNLSMLVHIVDEPTKAFDGALEGVKKKSIFHMN